MKLTENEIAKNIGILKAKPYLDKKKCQQEHTIRIIFHENKFAHT